MKKQIPYSTQWIDQKDIAEVVKVLKSDWITQGPKIAEFEKELAKYVGAKFAVAVNSGTSALVASCAAAGISQSDEVITTPYTFAASANCFVWLQALPVFVDIDEKTLNVNPAKIEKAVTGKTKAILTVDFAGVPCKYDQILKIAKKHQLIAIDDASHALGSEYEGKKLGTIADLTCFSFHPVKTITTGEGGMVTTNNEGLYQKLLLFRNHGITKKTKLLTKNEGDWYYEMQELGLNFRFTDIQAALGLSQLKKIDQFIKRRREIVAMYNQAFANLPVTLPFEPENCKSAWHLYPVRLKPERLKTLRKIIFDELQKVGLGVQVHYIPVHLQPYYRKNFGFKPGDFPVAEKAYQSEISLPLFPKMTSSQVNFVIKTFKNIISAGRLARLRPRNGAPLIYQGAKAQLIFKNFKSELLEEFEKVKKGKNPKTTKDIEAIVVLSGESGDLSYPTKLNDTEERTKFGVEIFKKIKEVSGNPVLVLNGTDAQNNLMLKITQKEEVKKWLLVKNPPIPHISTLTQFQGLKTLPFKKIAIVTHAYHGPRVKRYAQKYLPKDFNFVLFLLDRDNITNKQISEEIAKILKYSKEGDL